MNNNREYEGKNHVDTQWTKSYKTTKTTIKDVNFESSSLPKKQQTNRGWTKNIKIHIQIKNITLVCLPWVNDTVIVKVEEGHMLLKYWHVVVLVAPRSIHILCVRSNQSSWQIWILEKPH